MVGFSGCISKEFQHLISFLSKGIFNGQQCLVIHIHAVLFTFSNEIVIF